MSRILVLAPHPDDESVGCGGMLLKHAKQRDESHVVFLTSGEKGGHGRPEAETIRVREHEARKAARILSVRKIEFWHLPDGQVRPTPHALKRLRQKLKQFRPDRIYVTHEREMHPDHRGAARLLRRALTSAGQKGPEVYGYEVWTPIQELSEIVDVSSFMERKLRAVRSYRSQCAVVGFAEAVRGLNRYRGELHSWPGGNYAEGFTRMKL
jgi:N-acetylglucosamine malate deacetylase 1